VISRPVTSSGCFHGRSRRIETAARLLRAVDGVQHMRGGGNQRNLSRFADSYTGHYRRWISESSVEMGAHMSTGSSPLTTLTAKHEFLVFELSLENPARR